MVVVGGPSNFIVNQSLNLWNLEFKYFDLDFGLVESWGWVVALVTLLSTKVQIFGF